MCVQTHSGAQVIPDFLVSIIYDQNWVIIQGITEIILTFYFEPQKEVDVLL